MKLKWSKKFPRRQHSRPTVFAGLASSIPYLEIEPLGPKDRVLLGVVPDPANRDTHLSFQFGAQYFHVQPNHWERAPKPHWVDYRVIDCRRRRVTALPTPSTPYLTLSYLWGPGNHVTSGTDVLPACLPQVIEDALVVARELKFEYLWVDRYCIPQHDIALRTKMIKNMGNIYESSALTLIAAAGDGPEHGLSGVNPDGATFQSLNLGPAILTMTELGDPEPIWSSKWYTRGWTYQEGVMSSRRLVFMPDDLYFLCQSACSYGNLQNASLHDPWCLSVYAFPKLGVGFWIDCVRDRIKEYCVRRFTQEEDIIDAFRGVLTKFESMDPNFINIWGLPLYSGDLYSGRDIKINKQEFLAVAILWESSRLAERRLTAPSWTWAGWKFHPTTSGDRSSPLTLYSYHAYRANLVISADISFRFADNSTGRWNDNSSMRLRLRNSEEQHNPPLLIVRAFCFDIEWSAKDGNDKRIICRVPSAQFEYDALLRFHIITESDQICCKAVLIVEDQGSAPWPAILLVRQVHRQAHYERVGTARSLMYIGAVESIEMDDLKQKTQGQIEEIIIN
ncbi:hypothetical protein CJF32_00010833 [Rutstroemia sp. NJR-2017a WRK4]|nr:hypothetical protein CJF32_00010833 [Rutstroemia sp. NJR-2017a WRK4]